MRKCALGKLVKGWDWSQAFVEPRSGPYTVAGPMRHRRTGGLFPSLSLFLIFTLSCLVLSVCISVLYYLSKCGNQISPLALLAELGAVKFFVKVKSLLANTPTTK